MASDAGLSRYNGYSFQNFSKQDGLPDNVIIHLFKDSKNRIWIIGLNSKIGYYENDKFYLLKKYNVFADSIPKKAIITSAYISSNNELKLGFNKYYPCLLTFSFKTHLISQTKITTYNQIKIEANDSHYIYGNSEENLPFKKIYNSITLFNYKKALINKPIIISNPVEFLHYLQLSKDSFLLSIENAIFLVNKGKYTAFYKAKGVILNLYKDNYNRIWICVLNNGVQLLTKTENLNYTQEHLFGNTSFTNIIVDREASLWLTSLNKGIYQIPNTQIINYQLIENNEPLKINTVCTYNSTILCAGSNKWIYEFTNTFGFHHFFELKYKSEFCKNKIKHAEETFVLKQWRNSIIVGGYGSNILYTNKNKIVTSPILGWAGYRYIKNISPTYTSSQIIVGNSKWAMRQYFNTNKINNKIIECNYTQRSIYYDTLNNIIYIGSDGGLYKCVNNNLYPCFENQDLLKERINYINKKGNTFILSTREKGLVLWDGKKCKNITTKNGLCSNVCRMSEFDKEGNLWIGTANGISKIKNWNSENLSINNFTDNEGLINNDIYSFCIKDDEVWIANNSGLSKLNIHTENNIDAPVYITSLSVNDSTYNKLLPTTIPYNNNYIKINFNGLSFKTNKELEYEYRLIGIDSAWKKTNTPYVELSTLPPGEYKFEIYALKNSVIRSTKPTIYEFVIYPPIYKRPWFITLSAISFITLTYLFFWIRFKRLKKREEEKLKLLTQITETEIKALRAQTNPHFIFNALNSIRLFILKNDNDNAESYLMQFAQLMRDVLDNSELDVININKEISIIKNYVELESLRFRGKFTYETIIPDHLENANYVIPPLLLQPIVENAIWHGLMHLKNKNGKLRIQIKYKNDYLLVIIEDNGIGRKKSMEMKKNKISYKTSKGIAMTDDRITLFNKKNKAKISLTTIDLIDENDEALGTKTEITIRMNL